VEDKARERYISVIEAQPSINEQYVEIQRVSPTAGDGAFSLVFKANDLVNQKQVALKFFNPLRRGDDYRERCFDRECRILESLKGQRDILQLVGAKTELTLELVESTSGIPIPVRLPFFAADLAISNVKHYVYQEQTQPLTNLTYFGAMCRAVQRVHRREICHRDLKPDNFFRITRGDVCLGDFGSAVVLDGSEPRLLQEYDFWRGDRRYTAPEMFAAMDEDVRLFYCGDMFSLGAILFEMFTRHNLVTIIFDPKLQIDLLQNFQLINPARRQEIYWELIGTIAQRRRLPDLWDFGEPIPNCIRERLNRLYKGLAMRWTPSLGQDRGCIKSGPRYPQGVWC
jgi:serine/threonine protein kinase